MHKKMLFVILSTATLLALASCNLPFVSQSTSIDSTSAIQTDIADSVAQTLAAGGQSSTGADSQQQPSGQGSPPLPTLTSTPERITLTVSQGTYCRTGPGTEYPQVTTVLVGETVEVIARDPYGTSYYIRNPHNLTTFCWLWGQYATVSGNVALIPIFTPPPTPLPTFTSTPTIDFTVVFKTMEFCNPQYAPTFSITNNGSLAWHSVQIVVTDTITAQVKTHTSDTFDEWDGCNPLTSQSDLTPGEPGGVTTTSDPFNYNPSGNPMQATIKVCSQNGLGGTCKTKTVTFTP